LNKKRRRGFSQTNADSKRKSRSESRLHETTLRFSLRLRGFAVKNATSVIKADNLNGTNTLPFNCGLWLL
jgi:hypothetical protein